MDETLIAALLAFLTAIGLAFWNSWLARKAEIDKELRHAVAEFTKSLAAGNHAMSWLTWKAKNTPELLAAEDFARAGAMFRRSPEKSLETLAGYHDDVMKCEKDLFSTVADLLAAEHARQSGRFSKALNEAFGRPAPRR